MELFETKNKNNSTSTFANLTFFKFFPATLDPSTDPIITFPKSTTLNSRQKDSFSSDSYRPRDQYKSFVH